MSLGSGVASGGQRLRRPRVRQRPELLQRALELVFTDASTTINELLLKYIPPHMGSSGVLFNMIFLGYL